MAKRIHLEEAASLLKEKDHILILTHQSPDGDTMGSGFALHLALTQLGKQARVICADGLPTRFQIEPLPDFSDFTPELIVAVDVADAKLLGDSLQEYADCVDLCIDHHPSNTEYAAQLLLRDDSAATCEIIYDLLLEMGVTITPLIAGYLYMGISTDTGCFKFSNTTSQTHRIGAELIDLGADYVRINVRFFDKKSKNRIALERQALDSIRYFFNERCALMVVSRQMIVESNTDESELDGVSAIPRQIEGVEIGVTLREKENGSYKVSMRSGEQVDACAICKMLGGGGHMRAAGCTVEGTEEEAIRKTVAAIAAYTNWDGE